MFNLTPAAKNILIINGIIFLFTGGYIIEEFGLRYLLSDNFKPYQFLTYMWIHAGFGHLFSNMFAVLATIYSCLTLPIYLHTFLWLTLIQSKQARK